ncbi:MAG: hypothetical protein KDA70_19750 [Planctomycetaceae bacterium]|nr:hypothetical protein [Planctomycetaceae bacterium]
MLRPLMLVCAITLFAQTASAITLHIDMTPELVGDKGVVMKELDQNTTRFIIRISTQGDPAVVDPRFPFVRTGTLKVAGAQGPILRCRIQPVESGHDLLYTFDLENEHAKRSTFVLDERVADGLVGGGKVYSYRLIDFIDPDHRAKEFLQNLRPVKLPQIDFSRLPPPTDQDAPK